MLKKILPVLKKTSAVFAACLIFVSCLFVPTLAFDYGEYPSNPLFYTPYHFDKVTIFLNDGSTLIVDISDNFFKSQHTTNKFVNVWNDTGQQIDFNVNVDIQPVNNFVGTVIITFDFFQIGSTSLDRAHFDFSNSFIPVDYITSRGGTVLPVFINAIDGSIKSSNFSDVLVYPSFTYGDDGEVVSSTPLTLQTFTYSVNTPFYGYDITPSAELYDTYYPGEDSIVCFSKIHSTVVFNPDTYSFSLTVPIVSPGDSQSVDEDFYSIMTFLTKYFPINQEYSANFLSWIATAVGGFVSFEIMPGITISSLLLFIFGIGAVFAFLRYFAGG